MIQNGTIFFGLYCINCNRTFSKKDETLEDCPTCQETLVEAPPVMEIDEISFVFPEVLKEKVKNPHSESDYDYHSPINLRYLFQASSLPMDISLAYYRLDPELFKNILPLPVKSTFLYRDSDDNIVLFSQHREYKADNSKHQNVQIITGISDSRITGEVFMSDMSMRIVVRDLEEGFKKGFDIDRIFKGSILKDWLKSPFFNVKKEMTPKELENWQNLPGKAILEL